MQVIKRNGEFQEFDFEKIKNAIDKAFKATGRTGAPSILFENLEHWFKLISDGCKTINVEKIQDIVEKHLMFEKYFEVAKAYILHRARHEESRFVRERLDYMDNYANSKDNAATSSETDANANVTQKNVANLEGEVYKTQNRIIQRQRMKDILNKIYPEVAKQYEEDLNHHIIYTHDEASTPVLKQYCMAVSLFPLLIEGVGNIDGVTPGPPNDLQSFSGQITNLAFLLSSQCKGAVAFGEYFIALNYYVRMEFGNDWYKHLNDLVTSTAWKIQRSVSDSIIKAFKQFVWGINQPAGNRGFQSPFINISYYDKTYFDSLFGEFYYPDGTQPSWIEIDNLQRMFMKWFNDVRLKQILTFPVNF